MILVLIGPPGSGKGTISNHLKNAHDFMHISTGDLLREEVNSGSELGKEIAALINHGKMVPDQLSLRLMKQAMNKSQSKNFILDGYPRNMVQFNMMKSDLINDINPEEIQYIGLEIEYKSLEDRIINRYTCPKCGEIYNLQSKPPVINENNQPTCSLDSELLTKRKDDTSEFLATRFEIFEEITVPVLNHLKTESNFNMIQSNVNEKELIAEVCKVLKL